MEPAPVYDIDGMSDLERSFLMHWKLLTQDTGAPWPVAEYQFADDRKWRLDFAWPEQRVAVEAEGGIFARRAHGSISGILRDIEKYNAATALGWRVFRATTPMLRDDPAGFVEMVIEALAGDPPCWI